MADYLNSEEVNPVLMQFLDAETFDEKYKILVAAPLGDIDDLAIDNMAASIDVVIKDGQIDDRLFELKSCVRTRAKFETTRLRG